MVVVVVVGVWGGSFPKQALLSQDVSIKREGRRRKKGKEKEKKKETSQNSGSTN